MRPNLNGEEGISEIVLGYCSLAFSVDAVLDVRIRAGLRCTEKFQGVATGHAYHPVNKLGGVALKFTQVHSRRK